jgi:uncharacterized protein (UPF0335 family)
VLTRLWQAGRILAIAAASLAAQAPADSPHPAQAPIGAQDAQKFLDRLDRLESENQRLSQEIADLRKELAAAQANTSAVQAQQAQTDDRLAVQENRTAELDQKKVEASQKMPLQLTGMLLFNAFANGPYSGSYLSDPVIASSTAGDRFSGATLRQTTLGLLYYGPQLPGGGTVDGSVYMDFFNGTEPYDQLFRLRTADVNLRWKNTTITVGQDKPIIAPREPVSLAEVGYSPLAAAGNLWLWEPQARIEQRFTLTDRTEIRAQGGVYMSNDTEATVPSAYAANLERWRPAYEGRLALSYSSGEKRFEIAPGYHASTTHVIGQSIDSRAASLDWLVRPSSWWDFSGAWFGGFDFAGLGSLGQGFTILGPGAVIPIHGYGGWGQITFNASRRWSFHFFAGEEDDRAKDLIGNAISRNLIYGANAMWRLAPNVLTGFEISQVRTAYLLSGLRQNNHYDLALAYLF